MRKSLTTLVFIVLFLILSYNILMMPGDIGLAAPSYNEIAYYYLDYSVTETGAINVIAAVLADYRGFDTLGETIVLFISVVAVASILKPEQDVKKEESKHE